MVFQKTWRVSQNFSRIFQVSQTRFLAFMYVSQSQFFRKTILESHFSLTIII